MPATAIILFRAAVAQRVRRTSSATAEGEATKEPERNNLVDWSWSAVAQGGPTEFEGNCGGSRPRRGKGKQRGRLARG